MKEFIIETKKGEWHMLLFDDEVLDELCRVLNSMIPVSKMRYCGLKVKGFRIESNVHDFHNSIFEMAIERCNEPQKEE